MTKEYVEDSLGAEWSKLEYACQDGAQRARWGRVAPRPSQAVYRVQPCVRPGWASLRPSELVCTPPQSNVPRTEAGSMTAHVLMLAWAGRACRSTAFAVAKARGSILSMSLRTESASGHSWLRRSIPANSLRTAPWLAPHVPPKNARLEMIL